MPVTNLPVVDDQAEIQMIRDGSFDYMNFIDYDDEIDYEPSDAQLKEIEDLELHELSLAGRLEKFLYDGVLTIAAIRESGQVDDLAEYVNWNSQRQTFLDFHRHVSPGSLKTQLMTPEQDRLFVQCVREVERAAAQPSVDQLKDLAARLQPRIEAGEFIDAERDEDFATWQSQMYAIYDRRLDFLGTIYRAILETIVGEMTLAIGNAEGRVEPIVKDNAELLMYLT